MSAREKYRALASWSGSPFGAAVMEARQALDEIDELRAHNKLTWAMYEHDVETLRTTYQRDLQGLRDERDELLARRDEVMEQSGDAVRDLMKRNERAMNVALQYGTVDGAHHKQWVIDQMLRELTGDQYSKFVDPGWWDEGITP